MSALADFRRRLQQDDFAFAETLAFVATHYHYQPSAFRNGGVDNAAGQNEGSCKTLGLARLEGFSLEETRTGERRGFASLDALAVALHFELETAAQAAQVTAEALLGQSHHSTGNEVPNQPRR